MARAFGRILATIWDDEDFIALGAEEQRLYLFLLSQQNLNHAGLLPLTLRRWARKAAKLTATQLEEQLEALEAARFVVLDYDTEELLVRSLVRNDRVYKQPRVMGAMVADAQEIASPKLRGALLVEMDRLPLDELSDAPGPRNTASIRAQVLEHLAQLRAAFGTLPTPPQPPRQPLPQPPAEPLREGGAEGLWEPPAQAPADTPDEGDAEGLYARGRARISPSPIPGPLPQAPSSPPAGRACGAAADGLATVTELAPRRPDPRTTDELVADWLEHVAKRPPSSVIGRIGKSIKTMLDEGIDPADIRRGLAAWAGKGKDPSALPSFVNEAMNASPQRAYSAAADLGGDEHMARFLQRQRVRRAE